jgi:lipoate-protein ligase A
MKWFRSLRRRFHLAILTAFFNVQRKLEKESHWTDEEWKIMLEEAKAEYVKEFKL